MTRAARGAQYLLKAERFCRFARRWANELRDLTIDARAEDDVTRVEDTERLLFAALATVASLHDALISAASCLKERAWVEELNRTREEDPLLRFVWLARNADVHAEVAKWQDTGRSLVFRKVDRAKAEPFMQELVARHGESLAFEELSKFLFGVTTFAELQVLLSAGNAAPRHDRVETCGYQPVYSTRSLVFQAFTFPGQGASETQVHAPDQHSGMPNDDLQVETVMSIATAFYVRQLNDFRQKLSAFEQGSAPL